MKKDEDCKTYWHEHQRGAKQMLIYVCYKPFFHQMEIARQYTDCQRLDAEVDLCTRTIQILQIDQRLLRLFSRMNTICKFYQRLIFITLSTRMVAVAINLKYVPFANGFIVKVPLIMFRWLACDMQDVLCQMTSESRRIRAYQLLWRIIAHL